MNMKKSIYAIALVLIVGLCSGCGKGTTESYESGTQRLPIELEEVPDVSEETAGIELSDLTKTDYTHDYTADIKADVDYVVSRSASLQQELENIEKITQKYAPLQEAAQTQAEMTAASGWLFTIWDTEMNSLLDRFGRLADEQTKESLNKEQMRWTAMKPEVIAESLGSAAVSGSIYLNLLNALDEQITKNRAYVLANELAKIKGESFVMPEFSKKYGLFVDNQGTDSVYSFMTTRIGQKGEDEAIISVYRQGEAEGTFVDNGNGELTFASKDGSVKGIIRINGWDGASFKVTETSGTSVFAAGEEFDFPLAF